MIVNNFSLFNFSAADRGFIQALHISTFMHTSFLRLRFKKVLV